MTPLSGAQMKKVATNGNHTQPTSHHSSLGWRFFLAIFFDMMTVGMVAPLLPQYCDALGMSKASLGFSTSLYGIMQTLSTPVLGVLSDAWGQRPVLMVSLLGGSASYLVIALAVVLNSTTWFYAGRVLVGATRQTSSVGSAIVTGIYVQGTAQDSEARRKAAGKGLSWFSFAGKVGYCAGPALGGYLADVYGVMNVALVATVMGLANAVLMWYSVPKATTAEGREVGEDSSPDCAAPPKKDREDPTAAASSPSQSQSWRDRSTPIGFAYRVLREGNHTSFLMITMMLNQMAWTMVQSSMTFTLGEVSKLEVQLDPAGKQSMSMTQSGSVMAAVGAINAVTQFTLPSLLKRFPSYTIATVASLGACAGYVIQSQSTTSVASLCTGLFVSALCAGVTGTLNKSTFSSSFPSSQGGEVMSVVTSMEGFNRAVAPIAWGYMASWDWLPTAPSRVSLTVCVLAVSLYTTKVLPVLNSTAKGGKGSTLKLKD